MKLQTRNCIVCSKPFTTYNVKRKHCVMACAYITIRKMPRSLEHRQRISIALKGKIKTKEHQDKLNIKLRLSNSKRTAEANTKWKGDSVGYQGIHLWLRKQYGKPEKCEFCDTRGIQKKKWTIVYALKRGLQYERKRENFFTLCNSCHTKYDMTDEWRLNNSKGKKKQYDIRRIAKESPRT